MACLYTIDNKNYTLPEFKAWLVEGGLDRLYPEGNYPWVKQEASNQDFPSVTDEYYTDYYLDALGKGKYEYQSLTGEDREQEQYREAVKLFLHGDLTKQVKPKDLGGITLLRGLENIVPLAKAKNVSKVKDTFESVSKALLPFMGKGDTRHYLNGLVIDDTDNKLIASNGHIIAVVNKIPEGTPTDNPYYDDAARELDKQNPLRRRLKNIYNRFAIDGDKNTGSMSGKDTWIYGTYPDFTKLLQMSKQAQPFEISLDSLSGYANGLTKVGKFVEGKYIKANSPITITNGKESIALNAGYVEHAANLLRGMGHSKAVVKIVNNGSLLALESQDGSVFTYIASMRDDSGKLFKSYDIKKADYANGKYSPEPELKRVVERTEKPQVKQTDSSVKFSKAVADSTLAIIHNLTFENLLHSSKMGGIAVPSVAVVDKNKPMASFGEITLLADKQKLGPEAGKENRYFNADIYSPRYPRVQHEIDTNKFNKMLDGLSESAKKIIEADRPPSYDDVESYGVTKGLNKNIAMQYAYLESIGKAPKLPYKKKQVIPASMRKYVNETGNRWDLIDNPKFADDALLATIKEYEAKGIGDLIEDLKDKESRSAKNHVANYAEKILKARKEKDGAPIDTVQLSNIVRKAIPEKAFDKWLSDNFSNIVTKERIFDGFTNSGNRRYLPHDLDTVVKILTRTLKGGEGFHYGVPNIRAQAAKQFKTIKSLQSARGDIVSDAEMGALKKEVNAEFDAIEEELRPYQKYPQSEASQALAGLASKGYREFKEYYNDVPTEIMQKVTGFLNKLANMPTHYFEGKIGRAVGINEFAGAIVPIGKDYDAAVELLKNEGVTNIKRYKQGDDESRVKALNAFEDLFFSKATQSTGSTIEQVKSWLPKRVKPLLDAGKLKVVQSVEDLPDNLQEKGTALSESLLGGMQSSLNKDSINGIVSNSKSLGDFVKSKSIFTQAYSSLDAPAKDVMLDGVFNLAQDDKIRDAVIKLIPVDVVNFLRGKKLSTDMIFNNHSVFKDAFSSKASAMVSSRVDPAASALIRSVAINTAKVYGLDMTGFPVKASSAVVTDNIISGSKYSPASIGAKKQSSFVFSNTRSTPSNRIITSGTLNDRHDVTPNSNVVLDKADALTSVLSPIISRDSNDLLFSVSAWHGSPYDHDKFDSSKIGTGEGAQAFGYGLYFTDSKDIAKYYKDKLATAIDSVNIQGTSVSVLELGKYLADNGDTAEAAAWNKWLAKERRLQGASLFNDTIESKIIPQLRVNLGLTKDKWLEVTANKGRLYQVELAPQSDEYLDWDKPLSEQSEKVKSSIRDSGLMDEFNKNESIPKGFKNNPLGKDFYGAFGKVSSYEADYKKASELFHKAGIRGIRYKAEGGKSDANNYVIFSDEDVSITAKYSKLSGVEALYDTKSDKVYLVADMLNKDNANAILSHELFHRGLATDEKLQATHERFKSDMQRRFDNAAKGLGSQAEKEAYARVIAADTPTKDAIEEFQAYLVSQYEQNPQSLSESLRKAIKDFIAAIRVFLIRSGLDMGFIKSLTPADLAAMSRYGAKVGRKNYAQIAQSVMASTKAIPETIIIDGKERPARNSNGQLIHQTEEGIRKFWEWFGDSKVVDEQGRPLVVYHGTGGDFNTFKSFSSWFSKSSDFANEYAGLREHQTPGSSSVMSAYIVSTKAFNGDALPKTVTVAQFFTELLKQSNITDKQETASLKSLLDEVKDGAREEESGPHYSSWDFWHKPYDFFGSKGGDAIEKAFALAGFDSINFTEDGESTIGVLNPNQVKSATGNTGQFNPNNPDIRYSKATDALSEFKRQFGPQRTLAEEMAEDENAALNKRIREQHKTISQRAKQLLKREFSPGGLLPKQVFDLKISRDSEMNAEELIAHNIVAGLDRVVKHTYGKPYEDLSKEQKEAIDNRLKGEDVDLPDAIRDAVDVMRLHIDKLSLRYASILEKEAEDLAAEGNDEASKAKAELMKKIAGNVGRYVNRSYRAFDDKDWPKKIPDEVLNTARAYFVQQFTEKGSENPVKDAQRIMNDMVKTGTAYDTFEQYIRETKLGAKDLSVLIKKKEIAPEVLALLGEYKDARINFVKSATKMSRLIFNDDFLKQVKLKGLYSADNQEGFLFSEEDRPFDEHTVKIAADSSSPMAPLNGLYTYPEINQAFVDALNKEHMEDWYRMIVQVNGMVKYGKTVLSPTTAFRNWMSAYFFTMANGHFDMSHFKEATQSFKTYFDKDNGRLDYLQKLTRLGVLYDTPYAGEMMALLADSKFESALMGNEKGKYEKAKLKIKDWMDIATKFYRFGDDFWKIIGFENEKQTLMKYRNMSEQEAELEAAKRIRDTYPTYTMTGRAVNKLRRFPLVGTFVSFPAEIIRTSFNMLKYAQDDYKFNPELGRRRVSGIALASGFAYAAQALAMSIAGMDDDEEEALRDLAPAWSKNSNIVPFGRDKDGALVYMDLSFLDPYNYWKRPINAILRGQPIDETVYEIGREMFTPFFGQDITFGAIADIWMNKKDSGGRVFNPNDSVDNIIADIGNHLRKNLQPGIVNNIERMADAITEHKSTSGRVNTVSEEIAGLVGFRASRLNPKVALYYKSYEFQDKIRDASSILNDVARNPNKVSKDDLDEAYNKAVETRSEAFKDMFELVNASKKAGLSAEKIRKLLKSNHVSEKNITFIMLGKEPKWNPGKTFLNSSINKSDDIFDEQTTQEFKKRKEYILAK